jgi:hypothetical protein
MGEQLHQSWIPGIRSTEDTRRHWSAVSSPHPKYMYHCWINHLSIALAPSFTGLRHFPEGRNFRVKQWTTNDSKVLMKVHNCFNSYITCAWICVQVYLPAIEGHVPDDMVQAMCAFLEFWYIAHHNVHDTNSLNALDDALQQFHHHCEIFQMSGVCNDFNLPQQHSLNHYVKLIRAFGSPNGLCSSITESKHIKAVKEPWQCSSHFEALSQMLLTNQCLDKLAAARVDFTDHGMLEGTLLLVWNQILHMCFNYIPNNFLN